MNKRVVVVGSAGQDGRILVERLAAEGHAVLGIARSRCTAEGAFDCQLPASLDVTDASAVRSAFTAIRPDEVYYLAAHHHSSEEEVDDVPLLLEKSHAVHVRGLVNVLEASRQVAPRCRTFYAASSHVFGRPAEGSSQDETTPFEPRSIYAITKTAGIHACRFYRESYGVFAAAGILYNHESRYRAPKFVSTKIVKGALAAREAKRRGEPFRLVLGDLSAVVDWGYAPDYMDAAVRILASNAPSDFVIASGTPHTVEQFVAIAFARVGLDYREYVEQTADTIRRKMVPLIGNPAKLTSVTGWRPSVNFEEMIGLLVDSYGVNS